MKNIFCTFFFIFSIIQAKAQDFTYEDIVDDPQELKFLQFGIGLWDMDLNDYNMQIWNLNPRISFQHSRLFSVEAEYIRAIEDRFKPIEDADMSYNDNIAILKSKYKSESARKVSFTGTYYFFKKIKNKKEIYKLKQEGNVSYMSSIPTMTLRSLGLRIGYTQGSTFYALTESLTTNLYRLDKKDQYDNPYLISGNSSTIIDYSYFKLGLSFSKISNKEIKTDKYGKKSRQKTNFIYLDIFIRNKFDADDMYYSNGSNSNIANKDGLQLYPVSINHKEKLPVGGCLGFRKENASGHGFGYAAEVGVIPGFQTSILSNVYARINFSYQFAYMFKS
jgi:hypothetical protein